MYVCMFIIRMWTVCSAGKMTKKKILHRCHRRCRKKNPLILLSFPYLFFNITIKSLIYLLTSFVNMDCLYITISSRWGVLIKLNFYSSNHSFPHSVCLHASPSPTLTSSIFSPFRSLIIPIKFFI